MSKRIFTTTEETAEAMRTLVQKVGFDDCYLGPQVLLAVTQNV